MEARIETSDEALGEVLAELSRLATTYRAELAAVRDQLPELRRNARANAKRRGGNGSIDEIKYRLGSVLHMLGAAAIDDLALLGLLFNADTALCWLAGARKECGPSPVFELIQAILSDDERRNWCRHWGEVITWERNRALYMASVQSFLDSGKADNPKAGWRSKPPTIDQLDLIETISRLGWLAPPVQPTRGEAFDWIRREGGNPRYLEPPTRPPEWEIRDGE